MLVVHENRGLNPYIEDVARRLAKSGFVAFAPDALYPVGGYPGNDDEGRALQRGMDQARIEEDFIAAAHFLDAHELSNGRLGAVGFCFGGYIVNLLAAALPEVLDAGVPFYGTPAAEELRANVRGPLLLQFAELDKRVNDTWPDYERVLKASGAKYVAHFYAGVNHGFHNDSTGRYAPEAADLAWSRTIEFFKRAPGRLNTGKSNLTGPYRWTRNPETSIPGCAGVFSFHRPAQMEVYLPRDRHWLPDLRQDSVVP